ncbi:MAG: hypothetical protein H8E25_02805, partial [Planctomycetes bacterium]|nr:hypothetical protein [Planctomycetota bacterium]
MKKVVLSIVVAVISITAVTAQTLYVEPMYVGGDAVFEVSGGTPGAAVIICASVGGMGPTTLSSGVTLSLSTPLRPLPTIFVDVLGRSVLGPIPLPDNVSVGMQVWVQAVHLDVWSNPIATV